MTQRAQILQQAQQLEKQDRIDLVIALVDSLIEHEKRWDDQRDELKQMLVEVLLLEGLEGAPKALTRNDWQEMKRRYDERRRHTKPKATQTKARKK